MNGTLLVVVAVGVIGVGALWGMSAARQNRAGRRTRYRVGGDSGYAGDSVSVPCGGSSDNGRDRERDSDDDGGWGDGGRDENGGSSGNGGGDNGGGDSGGGGGSDSSE